jgi:type II secretion system protein H
MNRRDLTNIRRSSGFTLVELLLVLLIMSLFASSAVVSLTGRRDKYALSAAANDLAAAIRFAASESQARRIPHRVLLIKDAPSTGARAYRVEAWSPAEAGFIPAHGLAGQDRKVPEGIQIDPITPAGAETPHSLQAVQDADNLLVFSESRFFSGTIDLKDRHGHKGHISVLPMTHQVSLSFDN